MKELQEYIERLCKWSTDWLLGFNTKKCKVISFGIIHFEIEYSLTDSETNSHTLSLEDSECYLGISYKKNFNFDEHIDQGWSTHTRTCTCTYSSIFFSVPSCTLYLAKFMSTCTRTYLSNVTKYPVVMSTLQVLLITLLNFNQIGKKS